MANPNEFSQPASYLNGGPFETTWGPYATKELACLALKNEVDADGKNRRMGKKVAIGTVTDYVEHAWIGGFEDEDLEPYVKNDVDGLLETTPPIEGKNKFDINSFLDKTQISSDGSLNNTLTGYKTSAPIKFDRTKSNTLSLHNAGLKRYRLLDSNLAYINGTVSLAGSSVQVYPANWFHADAVYYQVTFKRVEDADEQVAQTQFEESNAATAFEPYREPKPGEILKINDKKIKNADLDVYQKSEVFNKSEVTVITAPISDLPPIKNNLQAFEFVDVVQPNVLKPTGFTPNSLLQGNGNTSFNSGYDTSDFFDVEENEFYTALRQGGGNIFRVAAFYKANGAHISTYNPGNFFNSLNIPPMTAKARVNYQTGIALETLGLFKGINPTFKPYGAKPSVKVADSSLSTANKPEAAVATIFDIKNLAGAKDLSHVLSYIYSGGTLIVTDPKGNTVSGELTRNKGYDGNNIFNFISYNMFGVSSPAGDDVAPTHTQNTTLGANHGQPVTLSTITAHGLTKFDIGTFWTAENGTKYYVMRIVDADKIVFLSENKGTRQSPSFVYMSTGLLTKGSSTLTVSSVNTSNQQLFSSVTNLSVKLMIDGIKHITSNTSGQADFIDVVESYDIMNVSDILNNIIARAGTNTDPVWVGAPVTRIENIYRFLPDSTIMVIVNVVALESIALADIMGAQAITFGNNAAAKYYVPNSNPVAGYDFRTPLTVAWSASVPPLYFTVANQPDPINPPNRVVEYLNNAGFQIGFLKTRGVGKALQNYTNRTFELRYNTGKVYPHGVEGSKVGYVMPAGSVYNMVLFRSYTSLTGTRTGNRLSYFNFNFEGVEYVFVDYSGSMDDKVNVNKPKLNGKEIQVIESRNCTIKSDTYQDGMYISANYIPEQTCFIVLAIK